MSARDRAYLKIHSALHGNDTEVFVDDENLKVETSNRQRFVRWKSVLFVRQYPNDIDIDGISVREGRRITHVVRNGGWGKIVDNTIEEY